MLCSRPASLPMADAASRRTSGDSKRVNFSSSANAEPSAPSPSALARAASVRDALVREFDFDADMFTTRGYGPSRPIATNRTPDGRQRNRRVEIIVTGQTTVWTEGVSPDALDSRLRNELEIRIDSDGSIAGETIKEEKSAD